MGLIKVFARMSPQGKASIIRAIQDHDKDAHVFMCGDGGNDVGALKQVRTWHIIPTSCCVVFLMVIGVVLYRRMWD